MHPKIIRALSMLTLAAATSMATPAYASNPHNFDVGGFLAWLKAKITAFQNGHGRGNNGVGTVPEPGTMGTLGLLGAGMGFAAWAARRRKEGPPRA